MGNAERKNCGNEMLEEIGVKREKNTRCNSR